MIDALGRGRAVLMFPEGERTHTGEVQPLKPGVALLIKRVTCPIVPVGIAGCFAAWSRFMKLPRMSPRCSATESLPYATAGALAAHLVDHHGLNGSAALAEARKLLAPASPPIAAVPQEVPMPRKRKLPKGTKYCGYCRSTEHTSVRDCARWRCLPSSRSSRLCHWPMLACTVATRSLGACAIAARTAVTRPAP